MCFLRELGSVYLFVQPGLRQAYGFWRGREGEGGEEGGGGGRRGDVVVSGYWFEIADSCPRLACHNVSPM